ncbi:MAG TPA: MEDS domain-containing protein [Solirubrobacteraceae bacterium]|nr:MEDS domain-containing protein [Solirubrobacteraceae bacterium]
MRDRERSELAGTNPVGIGQRVRAARDRRGWSREALAYHTGLSWAAITQIESGRRTNLRQATLVGLAEVLGVTIDYLVCGRTPSPPMLEHQVLLYEGDEELGASAAPFLAGALANGEAALAVTTKANLKRLRRELGEGAKHVRFAGSSTWYRTPAAALSSYQSFVNDSVAAGAPWVRIVGEPVWNGRSAEEIQLWARYESWLNLAFRGAPLTLVCPYDLGAVSDEILELARTTHPAAHEHRSVSPSAAYREPAEFILK